MSSNAYALGADAYAKSAKGEAFESNPYTEGAEEHEDWKRGWADAEQAAPGTEGDTEERGPTGEDDDAPTSEAPSETQASADLPTTDEVVDALGDAGYDRIMDLLTNPPEDFEPVPGAIGLPDDGEVPEDLDDWLRAWKQPLAMVTVDTALDVVRGHLSGASRGRLKELYRGMSPMAAAAAMEANAETISGFADQRVAEAGLIASMQMKVSQSAASYLLTALAMV